MKEGTPVTWLFGIIILVVYIGGYVWNTEKENNRLFEIANKQDRDWINSGSSIAAYWSRFKDELSGIDYIQFSF